MSQKKFISINSKEQLIRQAQETGLKQVYVWVYDESGYEIKDPYGNNVAQVLDPNWVASHPELRNPKGKLYFPLPIGPAHSSAFRSDFYNHPWGKISFMVDAPPADFNAFRNLIKERLDFEYQSMKRNDVLSQLEYASVEGSHKIAPPSWGEKVIGVENKFLRNSRFALVRLSQEKSQEFSDKIMEFGDHLVPSSNHGSEDMLNQWAESLGLKSQVSYRDYSGEYSRILQPVVPSNGLEKVLRGLTFRREIPDSKPQPHASYYDARTGEIVYILMVQEPKPTLIPIDSDNPSIDRAVVYELAEKMYAQDALKKILMKYLDRVHFEVMNPEYVFGPGSTRKDQPDQHERVDAIYERLAELQSNHTYRTPEATWGAYEMHIEQLPIRLGALH